MDTTSGDRAPQPDPAPADAAQGWWFAVPAADIAVPQARRAVADLLLAHGLQRREPVVDDLLLIVSELVTNAVRHAAVLSPEVRVEVVIAPESVRVSVHDRHPFRPRALRASRDDTGRTGGRGLLLVAALTDGAGGRCDVERTGDGGKCIWAELPRPREG